MAEALGAALHLAEMPLGQASSRFQSRARNSEAVAAFGQQGDEFSERRGVADHLHAIALACNKLIHICACVEDTRFDGERASGREWERRAIDLEKTKQIFPGASLARHLRSNYLIPMAISAQSPSAIPTGSAISATSAREVSQPSQSVATGFKDL